MTAALYSSRLGGTKEFMINDATFGWETKSTMLKYTGQTMESAGEFQA